MICDQCDVHSLDPFSFRIKTIVGANLLYSEKAVHPVAVMALLPLIVRARDLESTIKSCIDDAIVTVIFILDKKHKDSKSFFFEKKKELF